MENKPDIVDELERINKLTPDQAYQESVAEIGRAPSITDAQDAAARVPQAQIDAMKEKVAPPAAPAAPASPAAPPRQQQPQQPQTVIGRDGKSRTTFGGYVRVVDQKTGATTWEDLKGNAMEAPQSLRMMEAASSGISPNQGTATSWADAIEQQKAARLADAKTRGQQAYDFMLKSQKEREMQRAERNFTTAQAAKNALRLLMNEGLGEIKEHKGKKYRVVSVGGSSIDRANAQSEAMGRKSSLSKIAAYVQVDDDGKPIADPAFYMAVNKSDGSKASKSLVPLDLGRVMNQFSTSFATLNNVSEADARASTVSEFGGLNPFKWQVGANTPASVQAAQVRAESAKEVQELKNKGNLEVAQVAPKGGGKSTSASAGQGKPTTFDKAMAEAMSAWLKANGKRITVKNSAGIESTIDNPDYNEKEYSRRKKQYDEYLWGADEATPEAQSGASGGEEMTKEQRVKAAQEALAKIRASQGKVKPTTATTQPIAQTGKASPTPPEPQKKEPQPESTQKPNGGASTEVPQRGNQEGGSKREASLSERRDKEYEDGMKEIRATAEKRKTEYGWGGIGKWSDKDAEAYIRREEFMLKERLRKKYNNIQSSMK